jgi:hypothetical protein
MGVTHGRRTPEANSKTMQSKWQYDQLPLGKSAVKDWWKKIHK